MKHLILSGLFACLLPITASAADTPAPTDHKALQTRVLGVLDGQFGAFQTAAHQLSEASLAYCAQSGSMDTVKAAFRDTWLAWAPLDAYQFGPIETQGAALTVNFFPDKKGFVSRALRAARKLPKADQATPAVIAKQSAATQGLPAIERLIYDSDTPDTSPCPLLVGITGNLAGLSIALYDGWFADGGWADLVRAAGPDNPIYLTDAEFTKQIYTALGFSILRLKEHRLGRPLGTFERAFPKRAEAWRSGLTNPIINAQLAGMIAILDHGFAGALIPPTRAQIVQLIRDAQTRVDKIGAPIKDAVEDPTMRVRIEGVQSKLVYLQQQLDQDVGPELGVQTGFSAGDGD